jgi:hypothetical protein
VKLLLSRTALLVPLAILAAAGTWAWTRHTAPATQATTATLILDTRQPGQTFAHGAVGLSVDANELDSGRLSGSHRRLVQLMRMLGPSVLRIGGTSVDLSWWTSRGEPAPAWATSTVTPADLRTLRSLLQATGWRVLLGLNLGHFDPARAAEEAAAASRILGARLVGVEIGNEANGYGSPTGPVMLRPSTYDVAEYTNEAQIYRNALASTQVAVYGPAFSQTRWLSEMGSSASLFTDITQHYYPNDTCSGPEPPAAAPPNPNELLSPAERQAEDETLTVLSQVRAIAQRPTLIDETGPGVCRGNSSASPAFASALWALDWALRAASSGVSQLNFHGHFNLCGTDNQSPLCASTRQAANRMSIAPQPEYYGLLAATRLEGGRFLPTRLLSSTPLPNMTTWATIAPGGRITIAIDNLAVGGSSQEVLLPVPARHVATAEPLSAPSVVARTGVSLGDAGVSPSGQFSPRPQMLTRRGHYVRIVINPASAVIVTLHRARQRS